MDSAMGDLDVPAGFMEMPPFGPFHELVGPIYKSEARGEKVIGFRVGTKHRNKGKFMHGGMFLMLADTAMTYTVAHGALAGRSFVTTTLTSDFMAAASPGDWLEADVGVLRAGKSVLFLNCMVRRDGPQGKLLLRSSATFHVVPVS